MPRSVISPVACAIPLLVVLVQCHGPPRIAAPASIDSDSTIIGITKTDGDSVMFDPVRTGGGGGVASAPPRIVGDSLHATVQGRPYAIAADQVRGYWVRSSSTGRTVGLVAGGLAGTFLIMLAIFATTF